VFVVRDHRDRALGGEPVSGDRLDDLVELIKAHTGTNVTPLYLAAQLWKNGWRRTGMSPADALDVAAALAPVEDHAHDWANCDCMTCIRHDPMMERCLACGDVRPKPAPVEDHAHDPRPYWDYVADRQKTACSQCGDEL
jgi:hypothetical protein